jgi:hypothetical protein
VLRNRSFVAVVCIVALLAAAMAPIASASPVAILVPVEPLFGTIVSEPVERPEPGHPQTFADLGPLLSRGPPTA